MAIAIVILLLVVGSLIFHFVSPWWFTPLASNWGAIDDTINITFWVTGIVFVAVNVFLAYAVYKYRYKKDQRADYEPENKKLEGWLTLITTIGVAAMLAPGLFVWGKFVTVPEGADEVEAVGQQWYWTFRLPGDDGKLGRSAVELMDEANPFGLDPNDPNSLDDRLVFSNELHLPIDRPVNVLLRSKDVLHNFAVPQFRVKMDLVPGLVSYQWFTPTKIGRYELLCEELCGMAHFSMRGAVVVDSHEDYQQWLALQPTFEQLRNAPPGDLAVGEALYAVCAACHGAQGEGNDALNAPALAGQGGWYIKRQLQYYKQKVRGSQDPLGMQMAAMVATLADQKAIDDVTAYIDTFPVPEIKSVSVDSNGRDLYQKCAYCHGDNAQGNYAMNAPRLAGQSQAYLARQLENYKQRSRGNHPQDLFGKQMILMANLLHSQQDIDDVAKYLSELTE